MSFARLAPVFFACAALAAASSGCHGPTAHREHARSTPVAPVDAPPVAPAEAPQSVPAQAGAHTLGGLRYLEMVTGGANPDDALPLIVFFHGHGGRPEGFRSKFARFPARARVILPYGLHGASNGNFEWFPGGAFRPEMQGKYAQALPAAEATVAAALQAIAQARPTVGKPIASGFSQGAGLTYALALRHPDLLAAGCPMAGQVPAQVFEGLRAPATRPTLHAFIGAADPNDAAAKRTVEGFKSLGYTADLQVLPGFGHKFGPAESQVFGCLERAVRSVAR